jgi:hypothetical protein
MFYEIRNGVTNDKSEILETIKKVKNTEGPLF